MKKLNAKELADEILSLIEQFPETEYLSVASCKKIADAARRFSFEVLDIIQADIIQADK